MTTMPIARHRIRDGLLIVLLILVATAFSVAFGTAAWSFFDLSGHGQGSAAIATMSPPTNVIATFPTPAERTVHVSWDA
ncbi:MAG: hypothetical protein ABSG09_07305, partial [Acidimicrobiales bacterium]